MACKIIMRNLLFLVTFRNISTGLFSKQIYKFFIKSSGEISIAFAIKNNFDILKSYSPRSIIPR